MDNRPETFPERSLGEILNETFVIYVRHFWKIAGLAAVVQLPIAVVTQLAGEDPVLFAILGIVGVFGTFVLYGATIVAVGLQYINSDISILGCYRSAWWRVVSLAVLAVVLGGGLVLTMGLSLVAVGFMLQGVAGPSMVLMVISIALMAYLVYPSLAVQAVMLEGLKITGSIRRSADLVRGNWQRVFGMSVVIGLVVVGLVMLTSIPLAVAISIAGGPEEGGMITAVLAFVGGLVVAVVATPVGFIATTLIYIDLRTRKEGYGLNALSKDMGLQTLAE